MGARLVEMNFLFLQVQMLNILPSSLAWQSRPSVPDAAVLQVQTKRVEQLPLRDFASTDFGDHTQEFGFEMGPACFY